MRYAFQFVTCALLVVPGCSSGAKFGAMDEEFARMSEDERVRMGTNFHRDTKVHCREGLQNESASQSYVCLSARMKLERFCLTPR